MEVRFRTSRLRRCFEQEGQAVRQWGPDVGARYVERINLIQSLDVWDDLFEFHLLHCHPLHYDRDGQFAVSLTGRWRLIVEPVGESDRALLIVGVEDYHG